ncbi:putative nucleotide-binding protein [Psychrobacter sp. PL15]|uniref:nucleotide-binding protein n=1 Tax=Psychrobacter sp. PL15 TaxID=3071719 RepID=UPI002E022954|nr:putative nucleotide-binding protein [Psychrobacter sp. PL15]
MNKVKILKALRQDFQDLTYENYENQEKLSIRFTALISKFLDSKSAYIDKFNNVSFTPIIYTFGGSAEHAKSKEAWTAGHEYALQIMDDIIEDVELFDSIDNGTTKKEEPNKDYSKVFIVHGHDDGAKNEVARFIEKLGLEAIILHEKTSSGDTIIEKIIRYSNVGFGIVLYTPCDVGSIKSETQSLKPGARQNVIFEHGFLMGKIGRKNVIALVKDNVEISNDISGVVYESMDTGGAWKYKIAKEMKDLDYDIDMNKID